MGRGWWGKVNAAIIQRWAYAALPATHPTTEFGACLALPTNRIMHYETVNMSRCIGAHHLQLTTA